MRIGRAACAAAAGLVVVACGGGAVPSPGSSSQSSTRSAAPSGSASASATPLNNQAATFTLTADQLPASPAGTLVLVRDSLLSAQSDTDARVFATADRSFALEIDVLPDTSAVAASNDYSAVRDAARSRVSSVSSTTSPNVGDQADEYSGITSDGRHIVAIAFQQGAVLVAVLTETTGADAHAEFTLSVAVAQAQKIKSMA